LQSVPYALSLFALLTAVSTAVVLSLRKKIAPVAFALGGSLLILAAAVATAKWLPGGNFVFVWPLIGALLMIVGIAMLSHEPKLWQISLLLLLSVPGLIIFGPLLQGFFQALGMTNMGAPVLGLAFGLLFLLLEPLVDVLLAAGQWSIPVGAFL